MGYGYRSTQGNAEGKMQIDQAKAKKNPSGSFDQSKDKKIKNNGLCF